MQFGLDNTTVSNLLRVFASHPEVTDVVVYGSRAKGNFKPGSDIDITLKGKTLSLEQQNAIEHELDELNLPYRIDLSRYHQIDNQRLLEHIDRVGKRLGDKQAP